MKITILLILFILVSSSAALAQETKESPVTDKSSVSPTPRKRPDMNDLLNLTGQKAPDFIAADLSGTEYNPENLRGKIVVINLWATWCVPCVEEMPELNAMVNKFKDKDVIFLAATNEDKALAEEFLRKNPFSYHILPGALNVVKQYSPKEKPDPVTGKSRTILAFPTHIIIDSEGKVVKHTWGFGANKIPDLSQIIEQLLTRKT